MKIGASYYPEVMPREEWERDLATGREYGLNCLRCGEFAWAALLPAPDTWRLDWIADFLDLAQRYDYKVIWCTPSAAPPPHLFDRWPALNAVNHDGLTMPAGIRRQYCPSHEGYRALCAGVAQQLARAIGNHPALLGWQVDNEIAGDGFTCWCDSCGRAFGEWLQRRYANLEELNRVWQTGLWSQIYTSWHQIPVPHPRFPAHAPALRLAYRRFRSENWLAFYRTQADALRAHSPAPVSTNFFNYTWDIPFDLWQWRGALDAVGISHYLEETGPSRFQLALLNGACPGEKPLWVLEQKAGQQRAQNLLPDDPERIARHLRLCAEAGAEVAVYWHLRQHTAGCEQEHGAILRHDGRPGRIARAIRAATAECAALPAVSAPAARLLIFSFEQHWANEQRPAQATRWNYADTLALWHDAASQLWGNLRIAPPAAIAHCAADALVLAPHLQLCEPGMRAALLAFARGGGTLVITADCARLDAENNALREEPLAFLRQQPELAPVLPALEILHPQDGGAIRGELNGVACETGAFWAVPEGGAFADTTCLGTIACKEPGLAGPLAIRLPFGAGRILVVMTKTGRAGILELLRSCNDC